MPRGFVYSRLQPARGACYAIPHSATRRASQGNRMNESLLRPGTQSCRSAPPNLDSNDSYSSNEGEHLCPSAEIIRPHSLLSVYGLAQESRIFFHGIEHNRMHTYIRHLAL